MKKGRDMSRQKDKASSVHLAASRGRSLTANIRIKTDQSGRLTLAEARRKALEDIERAERAQLQYAEAEARRWYDYKDNE